MTMTVVGGWPKIKKHENLYVKQRNIWNATLIITSFSVFYLVLDSNQGRS